MTIPTEGIAFLLVESDLFYIDEGGFWSYRFVQKDLIGSESENVVNHLIRRFYIDQASSVVGRGAVPKQLEVEVAHERILNESGLVLIRSSANLVPLLNSNQA